MSALPQEVDVADYDHELKAKYKTIRQRTEDLCKTLEIEDWVVQPASFVSPPKWHLGHTSWFFVNFVLHRYDVPFAWPDRHFPLLFNSYYKSQSRHWEQGQRGHLSRPTVNEILNFRRQVDETICNWLDGFNGEVPKDVHSLIRLGLEHEQQHQELLLMDIKFILWSNPSQPAYFPRINTPINDLPRSETTGWWHSSGGLYEFGQKFDSGSFCFDNETPQHEVYLRPYAIANALVTNAEYAEFIDDGGYDTALYWLSEGWELVTGGVLTAPLYWEKVDGAWYEYGLQGLQPLSVNSAVKHISFHEAYAFARWCNKRLPTEFEWEWFARAHPSTGLGQFIEATVQHKHDNSATQHVHGGLWEWTSSPYSPYPGYRATMDAFGEYNGKFMINQMVLRGGCLASPERHYRPSYRNFYQPSQRWCFSGLRLAEDQS